MSFPERVYRLKLENLIPGDIIASTAPSSLKSRLIRWYTKGPMSHVALYINSNLLIEAIGDGVYISSPFLFVAESLDNVRVMRPKPSTVDFFVDTEMRTKLYDTAMSAWLARYSMEKALGFVIPSMRLLAHADEYICSELVARIYLSCAVQLSQNLSPEETSPNDICSSDVLFDITDTAFEEVRGWDVETVYGPILTIEREESKPFDRRPIQLIQDRLQELEIAEQNDLSEPSTEPLELKEAQKLATAQDRIFEVLHKAVNEYLCQRPSQIKRLVEGFSIERAGIIKREMMKQLSMALDTRRQFNTSIRYLLVADAQFKAVVSPSFLRNYGLHNVWLEIFAGDIALIDNLLKTDQVNTRSLDGNKTEETAMPGKQTDNFKDEIYKWFSEEEYTVRENPDYLTVFNFSVMDPSGRTVTVLQPTHKRDQIRIIARLELTAEQRAKIEALEESKKGEFLWNLRFALLTIGVAFTGVDLPLNIIVLETVVYSDGLTKDRFLEREFLVRRALLLVGWMMMREIGEAPNIVSFSLS